MRTFLRVVAVTGITVALGACAKAADTTGTKVTCGTGTHDDGAGTCQLDNALTLDNSVGNNYWACPDQGDRGFYYFYLTLGPNGSGAVWNPAQRVTGGNAYPRTSITWQEGDVQDEITVSANSYFDTLKQIVPSSPVGAQSFTANAYLSGVLVHNLTCQLTLGTF